MPSLVPFAASHGDWLVIIDRCEASVFRSVATGAAPQLIRSHSPAVEMRTQVAPPTASSGHERFRSPGFFEPLAGVLHGAQRILIFAQVTAVADGATSFFTWLREHCPTVAERVVAALTVEPSDHGERVLLAKARAFYRRLDRAVSTPGAPGGINAGWRRIPGV